MSKLTFTVVWSFAFALSSVATHAATLVDFADTSTGSLASGLLSLTLAADGGSISGSITNTTSGNARITAFGFSVPGNPAGLSASPEVIRTPTGGGLEFADAAPGTPPCAGVPLDFAYLTGMDFCGGEPIVGIESFQTINFLVSGPFLGLTEAEIAAGLSVRFQRFGAGGDSIGAALMSDPARLQEPTVMPEPASVVLIATGLACLARHRFRAAQS